MLGVTVDISLERFSAISSAASVMVFLSPLWKGGGGDCSTPPPPKPVETRASCVRRMEERRTL